MRNIIFCAGGTLGHINPALWVIKEYKKRHPNDKIIFIASLKDQEKTAFNIVEIDETYFLSIQGFNFKNIKKVFKTVWQIPKVNRLIRQILKRTNPTVVIGMGGYVSGLVINQAIKQKIKTIIHEQNSIIGLSNKLVANKVTHALASFPLKEQKFEVIGNPRYDEVKSFKFKGICHSVKPTICLVGGSLGAKFINELVIQMLNDSRASYYRFIIITGPSYYESMIEKLKNVTNKLDITMLAMTSEPIKYFYQSDVVITRSGATTLFELIALAKPSLLIPSPNVTKNHQYYNAKYMHDLGIADILLEVDVSLDVIYEQMLPKLLSRTVKDIELPVFTPTELFLRRIEDV